ncbi:MAG: SpoIID/LytB domain-containing protein [Armatimonadota bacterium]
MHRKFLFTFIAFGIILSARAFGETSDTLRVGLTRFSNCASLTVSSSSGAIIISSDGNKTASSVAIQISDSTVSVRPDNSDSVISASPISLSCDKPDGLLILDSPASKEMKYRGSIEVSINNGKLSIVNIVNVEDYLLGVMPAEMGDSSPTEALRAQAITARTYALGNKRKHSSQGFDVCDSTHCQTYNGANSERARCSQAVIDTKGMALTYDGKVAEVMYSTDCGGATVNYSETHPNSNFPYLCGTVDPDDIARITWEQPYTLQKLGEKLVAAGVKEADGLQNIVISKTGSTGRPLEAQVTGTAGSTTVKIEKIRAALGFKSAMFTIESDGNGKVVFKGKGSGHGVGLCQRGTIGLASAPHNYTYAQILAHYFPGTVISGGAPVVAAADVTQVDDQILKAPVPVANKHNKTTKAEKQPVIFDVRLAPPDSL